MRVCSFNAPPENQLAVVCSQRFKITLYVWFIFLLCTLGKAQAAIYRKVTETSQTQYKVSPRLTDCLVNEFFGNFSNVIMQCTLTCL